MTDESYDVWRSVFAHYKGQNDRKIAQDLGISPQTVFKHRRRLGIAAVLGPKFIPLKTDLEWQQVFLTIGRKTYREIASILGCHVNTVQAAWSRLNQSRKPRGDA